MRRDVGGSVKSAVIAALLGLLLCTRCGSDPEPGPPGTPEDVADGIVAGDGADSSPGDTTVATDDGTQPIDDCGPTGACPDEDVPPVAECTKDSDCKDPGKVCKDTKCIDKTPPDCPPGCDGYCGFCELTCTQASECIAAFNALTITKKPCDEAACVAGHCAIGSNLECEYDTFPCKTAAECATAPGMKLPSTCYDTTCADGTCGYQKTSALCCVNPADCAQFKTDCTQVSCAGPAGARACAVSIVAGCCQGTTDTVVMNQSFAGNDPSDPTLPQGWTAQDLQTVGADSHVQWRTHFDPDVCFSGASCVNVGWSDGTDYCYTYFDGPFTSPCVPDPLKIGAHIQVQLSSAGATLEPKDRPWVLSFQARLDGEPPVLESGLLGDHLLVQVVDGPSVTQVFDSTAWDNTTGGAWKDVSVNLSAWAGKTIQVRWIFDTGDGYDNDHQGVFLDDIQIKTICNGIMCTEPGECVAEDPCHTSSCSLFPKITPDETEDGACLQVSIPGCAVCTPEDVLDDCTGGANPECVGGVCQYTSDECTPAVLWAEEFTTKEAPQTWKFQDDPPCNNAWTVVDQWAASEPYSLHFGDATNACGPDVPMCVGGKDPAVCPQFDGCANAPTAGFFETAPLTKDPLPASGILHLSFDLFLSTEFDQYTGGIPKQIEDFCSLLGTCLDRLQIFIVYKDPQPKPNVLVWDSYSIDGTTKCQFLPQNIDLTPYKGHKVALRFEFANGEAGQDNFEGVYIDNLRLEVLCTNSTPCTKGEDCGDIDKCTVGICDKGFCKYEKKSEDCCITDAGCNQADNQCIVGVCGPDQLCTYTISPEPSCCDAGAVYWKEGFDGSALPAGWTIATNGASPVKWQWDTGKTGGGLYFGDVATKKFADGNSAVSGSITTPALQLPPGGTPTFRMDLFASTEFDTYTAGDYQSYDLNVPFDRLAAFISGDGGKSFEPSPVWRSEDGQPLLGTTKDEAGVVSWADVAFAIPKKFAGKKIVLRFEFASGDGGNNGNEGVRIDNVRISQVCADLDSICLSDAYCKDKSKCTSNACTEAGKCVYADATEVPGCCFATAKQSFGFESAGDPQNWTLSTPTNSPPAKWQIDQLQPPGHLGKYSLHFGNAIDGGYSGCPAAECGADKACQTPTCDPSVCDLPKGIATSPVLTIEPGKDYTFSFDLFAGLFVPAGKLGAVEAFTVKLMYQTGVAAAPLATLLCHAGECDVQGVQGDFDPCKSGINFKYPGCDTEEDPGDYNQWLHRSFKLSQLVCAAKGSAAETFAFKLAGKEAQEVWIQVEFAALDNFDHCGPGLFVDDVTLSELCTGWDAICQ